MMHHMNKMKRGMAGILAGLALWMVSGATFGMGLASPVSRAILGDTLSVSVPVHLDAGEILTPECVRADVLYGEDKLSASAVQVQLKERGSIDRPRDPVVQVKSNRLINEPVVTLFISVGCQTQITRKMVLLVDPPDVSPPTSAAVPVSPVIEHRETAISMVQDPASKSSSLGRKAQSFSLSGAAVTKRNRPAAKTRSSHHGRHSRESVVRRTHPVETAKLELDPVAADATVAPDLQMSAGLQAVPTDDAASAELQSKRQAAAALWRAMNASPEELARDRQRLDEVEHKLDTLGRDNARASEALSGLQARLAQQSSRGLLVPVLVGLVVLMLALMAWREWSLRQALARQSSWLNSRSPEDSGLNEPQTLPSHEPLPSIADVLAQDDHVDVTNEPIVAPAPAVPATPAPRRAGLRNVSVEELIDLEQQAEFFLVLGQEDSAIEVLESYIGNTSAVSPMPFLKLLEIYRNLGMRADYERTRMNFNLQFNAHAPLWDADPSHGHALKDYPGVLERVQALWPYPDKALEVLERSLMRQDAESYTFDLPAYRELLLLYSVLRDLTEHESQGYVDVGGTRPPAPKPDLDTDSPLMATLPMKALPDLAPTLSLDLELDDLDEGHPSHPPTHKP